eukprot:6863069-Heterocapsa_arctica.AAC.1
MARTTHTTPAQFRTSHMTQDTGTQHRETGPRTTLYRMNHRNGLHKDCPFRGPQQTPPATTPERNGNASRVGESALPTPPTSRT